MVRANGAIATKYKAPATARPARNPARAISSPYLACIENRAFQDHGSPCPDVPFPDAQDVQRSEPAEDYYVP
jgi:hypothetical protein